MAKEIKQIGIVMPAANTETLAFEQGTAGLFLVTVAVTNQAMDDARFDIWVNDVSASTSFGKIASGQLLPGRSSFETVKFTLDFNDKIYIKSTSSSVSFLISGLNQTE